MKLVKEPDNEFDKEAIKVELDGLGLVGYVANSPFTVQGESMSEVEFMIVLGILQRVLLSMFCHRDFSVNW